MGAWSGEPFGNDTASDWVYELDEADDWQYVREALEAAVAPAQVDADTADCAIAAAEVVARGLGREGGAHADTIRHFVERAGRPDDELVALALAALSAADSPGSELTELWEDADPQEWREANAALRSVLEEG
ncbi:DUF4259 domain-containing protein [Rathayibacter sp. ZW T2_19]|uniref:DUF4259 domain-containing protein n=1 Tax=Rathayibacter rubneri TaxID=2950106 RepID=A0A9X2DZY5_9MICO|nr:DUF4259 domain-containing protein [Rathayibacter rubneri]MCM6763793.1 DUF4259 domain-containing protein [Rathayibacter rubneri]